jgi:hypothetical protein
MLRTSGRVDASKLVISIPDNYLLQTYISSVLTSNIYYRVDFTSKSDLEKWIALTDAPPPTEHPVPELKYLIEYLSSANETVRRLSSRERRLIFKAWVSANQENSLSAIDEDDEHNCTEIYVS